MMPRKPVIAVVGEGREAPDATAHARELGRMIAENGWTLVTGGRDAGVMRAASEGAKEVAGSLTVGILPNRKTDVAPHVDVAIFTDMGEARNNVIVLSADVIIACGIDGPGTASEVALAIKNLRPVIMLGASEAARTFYNVIGSEDIRFSDTVADAITICNTLIKSSPGGC